MNSRILLGLVVGFGLLVSSQSLAELAIRTTNYTVCTLLPPSGPALRGVAHGQGLWVAVGKGGCILKRRERSWNEVPAPIQGDLVGVTHGEAGFVAVASDGRIALSIDGEAWRVVALPGERRLTAVTHGLGLYVAVGDGVILTSKDAVTWKTSFEGTNYLAGLCWGPLGIVVVGDEGLCLNGTDAVHWTQHRLPDKITCHSVAGSKLGFVAVGPRPHIAFSRFGTEWSRRWLPMGSSIDGPDFAVACGNGRFVTVGNSGVVFVSSDGLRWQSVRLPCNDPLFDIEYGSGEFVAVGNLGHIESSADGTHWLDESVTRSPRWK